MKFNVLMLTAILALGFSACNSTSIYKKIIQAEVEGAGLSPLSSSRFDASYVLSSLHFSQFKKLIVEDLDLSNVAIIKPRSYLNHEEEWELNDKDKQYYQAKYKEAVTEQLFDSNRFSLATEAANDTLTIKAKITEIAPLASKDDAKGRPGVMDVYSKGFGRMTIVFEVFDSSTHKLVAAIADEQDLGDWWEKNNRAQNNQQIRVGFDNWLRYLKKEMDAYPQ